MKKILISLWPILCIVTLWTVFSSPYFFKHKVPFPSSYLVTFFPPWNATYGMPVKNNAMPDVISQIYPWKIITMESWKKGQIPLWNPYSFSGTVHAGNYQSAVFSPLNIVYGILPFLDAWSVLILLQPLLAAIGMYFFIRSCGLGKSQSLIAALAFMFCGFMTTWMAYGTLVYAALCLPWALWAVNRDFGSPGILYKLFLSLSIAVSFVSGHFQISLYVLAAVTGYIVYESFRLKKFRSGFLLLLHAILGIGIAAPQILLTLDAYRISERSSSFIKGEIIPWKYFITVFAPDFYGNPVTRNDWFGHYAEWASYIGVVPFLLAAGFVRKLKNTRTLYFVLLAVLSFVLAYPTPLADLLFALRLPAISTSAASRIMVLFSFSLAVLSAFGLDELLQAWRNKTFKRIYLTVSVSIGILSLLWIFLLIFPPFSADNMLIAKRNLILPSALTLIFGMVCLAGTIRRIYVVRSALIVLVVLTGFDVFRYAAKWMPFDNREDVYPPIRSLKYLQTYTDNYRVFGNMGSETGNMFRIPLIEGYDAVYQGRYGRFMQAISKGIAVPGERSVVQFDKNGLYKTEALQLMGVKYIYHRKSDGRNVWAFPYWEYTQNGTMKQIYSDDDYWIYEYTDVYPRAFLASGYRVVADDDGIIRELFSPDTNRRETLILESEPPLQPEPGDAVATISAYSPNRVTVDTTSAVSKLLFLSDVFDPGWHAMIDGKETGILRADYAFRAVAVPPGKHSVTFTYFPESLKRGMIITLLSVVAALATSIVGKKL